MAAAATGASTTASSTSPLNTMVAKLNVASSIGNIIATPFAIGNAMSAAKTEARNAAATAEALEIERKRALGIFDRETRSLAAEQTISYIMSGVELSSGTPRATMESTLAEREADRIALNQNYQTQIDNARRAEEAAKKARRRSLISGAAQMAGTIGALAVFSDERLKENLILVGKANNGLNIYLGKYTKESGLDDGKVHLFLIAQEVQKIKPEAVIKNENGYLMVDYAKALL